MTILNDTSRSYCVGTTSFYKVSTTYTGDLIPKKTKRVSIPEYCDFYRESGFFKAAGSNKLFLIYGHKAEFPYECDLPTQEILDSLTELILEKEVEEFENLRTSLGFGPRLSVGSYVFKKVSHTIPKVSGMVQLYTPDFDSVDMAWLQNRDSEGVYRASSSTMLFVVLGGKLYVSKKQAKIREDVLEQDVFSNPIDLSNQVYSSWQLLPSLTGGAVN